MKMNMNQILQQFESVAAGTKTKSAGTGKAASKETLWKNFLKQFPGLGTAIQEDGKAGTQMPKIKIQKQDSGKKQSWSIPMDDMVAAEVSVSPAEKKLAEMPEKAKKDSATEPQAADSAQKQNPVSVIPVDKKTDPKTEKKKTAGKDANIVPVTEQKVAVPPKPEQVVQDKKPTSVKDGASATNAKQEISSESPVKKASPEPLPDQKNVQVTAKDNKKEVQKEGLTEPKTTVSDKQQRQVAESFAAPVNTKEKQAPKRPIITKNTKPSKSDEAKPKQVSPKDITEPKVEVAKSHNQDQKPIEQPVKNDGKVEEHKPAQTVQKDISPEPKSNPKKLSDLPGVRHHVVEQKADDQKISQPVNHQNRGYDKAEFTKHVSDITGKTEQIVQDKKPVTRNATPANVENKVQNSVHEAVEAIETGQIKSGKKEDRTGRNQSEINFLKTDHQVNVEGFKQTVSSKIAQVVQKQISQGKSSQWAQWQQHKFIMDDGKSINLAMKQTDGIIHLQIGSNNTEMNQMLQHHIQDIKVHLQEHFKLEIDLQFQNTGYQGQGNNGNTNHQQAAAPAYRSSGPSTGSQVRTAAVSESPSSVRLLGFNRNEWTG